MFILRSHYPRAKIVSLRPIYVIFSHDKIALFYPNLGKESPYYGLVVVHMQFCEPSVECVCMQRAHNCF